MLDLNIASSTESSSSAAEKPTLDAQVDDSGTSNSSVLNEEDSCSTNPLGFQFGILKNQDEQENDGFATKDLFPMGESSSSLRQTHFVDHGLLQREKNQQQQQQQHSHQHQQQVVKKSRRGPRSRSSQYRGVTFYRRTGRWESHIWDCGKQVYLGGFDTAHAAARAYDRAAIKFRGVDADINFNLSDYDEDLKQMANLSKEEFVHILRRQSTGFSRGSSKYRGVTLHKCGRWEARMGQFLGKNLKVVMSETGRRCFGNPAFTDENMMVECRAYDKAAIKYNGREAVTNFEPGSYEGEMLPDVESEAIGHDLDLNLRISQPNVSSPKRRDNPMNAPFHLGSFEASDAKKSRADYPSMPSSVLGTLLRSSSVTNEHPPAWPALYPGFFPSSVERGVEKRPLINSHALPNWTWQVHGSSAPLSPFSSAASSGFATSSMGPPPPAPYYQFRN